MRAKSWLMTMAASLCLAACGSGGSDEPPVAEVENATANGTEAAAAGSGPAPLDACPFRATTDWAGSVEGGRLLVNGRVDLLMAGFRPTLTERPGAGGGTVALDLALLPEANAAVNDRVRYERAGASGLRRAEIWCGGERIETIELVLVE